MPSCLDRILRKRWFDYTGSGRAQVVAIERWTRKCTGIATPEASNKEIAGALSISLTTVETHRTHILQKLGLHSVPELILYAVKGIIS